MNGRPYDLVTFDCYGTLIDWERGISTAFVEAAAAEGCTLDAGAVLTAYAEIEPRAQLGGYRTYREVLRETARTVAARLGWPISDGRAGFLADSLVDWRPFPDTNPALERLAGSGYALGILSNIDDDLLEGTLRHLRADFEVLVTAQRVQSYKPAPAHFLEARSRAQGRRWLHAAQSQFHDVAPACAIGIPVAWINRKRERPSGHGRPVRELASLAELAAWLASGPSVNPRSVR